MILTNSFPFWKCSPCLNSFPQFSSKPFSDSFIGSWCLIAGFLPRCSMPWPLLFWPYIYILCIIHTISSWFYCHDLNHLGTQSYILWERHNKFRPLNNGQSLALLLSYKRDVMEPLLPRIGLDIETDVIVYTHIYQEYMKDLSFT